MFFKWRKVKLVKVLIELREPIRCCRGRQIKGNNLPRNFLAALGRRPAAVFLSDITARVWYDPHKNSNHLFDFLQKIPCQSEAVDRDLETLEILESVSVE